MLFPSFTTDSQARRVNRDAISKALYWALRSRHTQIEQGTWSVSDEWFWDASVSQQLLFRYSESGGGQVSGKYLGCRYWSVSAVKRWRKQRHTDKPFKNLRHEHVFPRTFLNQHLRRSFKENQTHEWVEAELNRLSVACIVTKAEDDRLAKDHPYGDDPTGLVTQQELWSRYTGTGVEVVDHCGLTDDERAMLRAAGCLTTLPAFCGVPMGSPVGSPKQKKIL